MRADFDHIFKEVPPDIDLSSFDSSKIPKHIGVIMDGNGRWAKKRALNRLSGHKAGISAVRETIRTASDLGVDFLTIYSFSTENWKRTSQEVYGLFDLFAKTMLAEVDELDSENVKVKTIGDLSPLPQETIDAFVRAELQTKDNTGLCLVVAINYGGRSDIVEACKKIASSFQSGEVIDIDEKLICKNLSTKDIPDPDLIIRTSGEKRLSNFFLWQAAYSEFVSCDVLWPDFDRYDFLRCLLEFMDRSRRFGKA